MVSVAKEVWAAIEEDVIVRRALEKGIIGVKALALYVMKQKQISANADAVISAIRRYKEVRPLEKQFEKARKVIATSEDVRITSSIVSIALEKNRKVQEKLARVFSAISYERGELLLINQGELSIKLIINSKNRKKVLGLFDKSSVIHVEENIAQINIHLSDRAVRTPGIISLFSTELMMHDVNMVEMMSSVPEILFFIKETDVVKAYKIIFDLCRN